MTSNSLDGNRPLDAIELPLKPFGVRSQTVLRQLNITTVGEFLAIDWTIVSCWQLGVGTREQLRQIHENMSRDVEEWIRKSTETSLLEVDWPDDIVQATVPVALLSVRAQSVLQRNKLNTLAAFLNFDWEHALSPQLGAKTRMELSQWRAEMGRTPEEVRAWMARNETQSGKNDRAQMAPNYAGSQSVEAESGRIDWPRLWPCVVQEALDAQSRDAQSRDTQSRLYEVLERRFSLNGHSRYNFEDLGLRFNVTRERVRQVETTALLRLERLLNGDTLRGSHLQLHPRALQEQVELKQLLEEVGFPVAEEELWDLLDQRYQKPLDENERAHFRLLLELWGFASFSPAPPEVPQKLERLWLENIGDRAFVGAVLRSVSQSLRERVEPVSLFDLQIAVNRALKAEKITRHCDEVALQRLVGLWPRAEEVAPEWFQTRWEFLPSNQSRAERILREWAASGILRATVPQICQEINHRHALAGRDDNAACGVVSTACGVSSRITNIGKSGQWTLLENAGETRPVHEIIKEALLKLNRRATIEELTEYVAERRDTSPQTVACLMTQHSQFQRVGRGIYALRAWGMPDAAPVRRGEEYQREFDDLLLEIFFENDLKPINHASLANQMQKHLGWHISTVRMRIERSGWIETTSINGFHLMAHLRDKPEVAEEKPERLTKTRRVHEIARAVLQDTPQRQMRGGTLSTLIEAQTNFVKPLIYSALAAMPDVERRGEPGAMIYALKQ